MLAAGGLALAVAVTALLPEALQTISKGPLPCLVLAAYGAELPAQPNAGESYPKAQEGTVEFPVEESSASSTSTLTGHIEVKLISVELPAGGLDFEINPEIPFQLSDPGAQITSPAIEVTNRSVVPVRLEISQVAEIGEADLQFSEKYSDKIEQSFRLVDKITGTTPPGTAILVLGLENQVYSSAADFEQYAIMPGKENIFVTTIPAEGSRKLNLYGKATPDFYGEYSFTVRPTLKISAAPPEPADS